MEKMIILPGRWAMFTSGFVWTKPKYFNHFR